MQDVTTMEAGRELDALVAERVMRLVEIRGGLWKGNDGRYWYLGDPQATPRTPHTPFYPSTDIAAAWQVVEALRGHLMMFSLEDYGDYWRARFEPCPLQPKADTAPLAICRAALLAVAAAKEAQDA